MEINFEFKIMAPMFVCRLEPQLALQPDLLSEFLEPVLVEPIDQQQALNFPEPVRYM